jgi:hypothetical protein
MPVARQLVPKVLPLRAVTVNVTVVVVSLPPHAERVSAEAIAASADAV